MIEREIAAAEVKNYGNQHHRDDDEKDFIVRTKPEDKMIDSLPERDDQCTFERDMYNFGDQDDLPDSDRAMDKSCKNS